MKEDAIIEVLKLRLKKLKKHFLKLQESFDPEEVHDYRLEMKKLKAFLRLINTHRSLQEKVRLDPRFRRYYALTGDLRNLQLHEQRILTLASEYSFEEPVSYVSLLREEKEKVITQLQKEENEFSSKNYQKEILSSSPLDLKDNKQKGYLENQRNTLMAILVPATSNDDALHEVRKVLKDIGYNRDYLGSYMSLLLPSLLVKKENADVLSEKLGIFHDLCVSEHFLHLPAVLQIEQQEESVVLHEMQRIVEYKKKQAKKEVLQQLTDGVLC